ncbi:MAG: hypothetical protein RLY21_131 [Planctomycetota bacterium]|jgi:hypothetical protein
MFGAEKGHPSPAESEPADDYQGKMSDGAVRKGRPVVCYGTSVRGTSPQRVGLCGLCGL